MMSDMVSESDYENEQRKARLAAIEQVYEICESFWVQHQPTVVAKSLIEAFIERTAHIGVETAYRLIPFAVYVKDNFGFEGMCAVYQYMVDFEPEELHAGTYGTWIGIGLQEMKPESGHSYEKRTDIAKKVGELIESAGGNEADIEESTNYAGIWGQYYLHHPERTKDSQHLVKATRYLHFELEQKRAEDELDAFVLCQLANCYLELEQYDKAAKYYQEINLSSLENTGKISKEAVLSGLAFCVSKSS